MNPNPSEVQPSRPNEELHEEILELLRFPVNVPAEWEEEKVISLEKYVIKKLERQAARFEKDLSWALNPLHPTTSSDNEPLHDHWEIWGEPGTPECVAQRRRCDCKVGHEHVTRHE